MFQANMLPIILALLSSVAFAASQIIIRKNIEESNHLNISLTVTIMGNIVLWPIAILYTDFSLLNLEGILLFLLAGFLAPGLARLVYFKGMKTVGISVNSSIFSTYPLYTSIIAVTVLGEVLTTQNWIGLICIIAGVIFISKTLDKSSLTKHATIKGLIIPVLGSFTIAFSQIIRKEGLNIYNQPLLGVAIGYTTSLIFYLIVLFFSKTDNVSKFSKKDFKLFWKSGVGIATGWLLSFLALSQEMVSIIVPLLQTELLFILLFSYIFLRKIEKFSFSIVTSALLIIAGIILISFN
ncbi:MAG: DMT family transporter [Candidatus Bathyarchaeota archaeon]|nr:MAG: DMT family transporter [Candidatus Bathyarchaeota archaeon]